MRTHPSRPSAALLLACAVATLPGTATAQEAKPTVRVGGFAEVYYAWDFGRPPEHDRYYTTQPARHNEFNLNLGFLEAALTGDRVRGRLALQAGTSVQANYAAEPSVGTVSGSSLSQHVQEAVVGVRVAQGLWLDGGIYFSHIGQEGWVSRDNPTWSRSLIADYSPYYSAGVKATWQATPKLTAQLHLVNGWQNISETNGDKAVGLRLDWAMSPKVTVGYSNFLGNELPDSVPAQTRFFNELFTHVTMGATDLWLTLDYGRQDLPDETPADWLGAALIGRVRLSPTIALSGRVERYHDPDQVIIATGQPYGFSTWGGSLGLDLKLPADLLWRTELRGFRSEDPLWPDAGNGLRTSGGFVGTSLAITF